MDRNQRKAKRLMKKRKELKTFTCKCGCGESRQMKLNELTAKFIDRSHYGTWLKTNHNLWGSKANVGDESWYQPDKVKSEFISMPTGTFPLFV